MEHRIEWHLDCMNRSIDDILNNNIENIKININENPTYFVNACTLGNIDCVKFILQIKPDIVDKNLCRIEHDAFEKACSIGHVELVKYLVDIKYMISLRQYYWVNEYYEDVIMILHSKGYIEYAKKILEMIPDVQLYKWNGRNFIFRNAYEKGYFEFAKWLLEIKLDEFQNEISSAFVDACEKGRLDFAKWLSEKKQVIYYNHWMSKNRIFSKIIDSSMKNHVECAKLFLKTYPDIDISQDNNSIFKNRCYLINREIDRYGHMVLPHI